jgi:ankyrin repeat protein
MTNTQHPFPPGSTALFSAIVDGDALLFRHALIMAPLNEHNEQGDTPLLLALKLGEIAMAEQLIERGADLTLRDANGLTVFDVITAIANDYNRILGGYKQLINRMGERLPEKPNADDKIILKNPISPPDMEGNVIYLPVAENRRH